MRIEPPRSLPSASGDHARGDRGGAAARRAAARERGSQGLRVAPKRAFSVTGRRPELGRVRLADDDRARLAQPPHVCGVVVRATQSPNARLPSVVGRSSVAESRSLSPTGTPQSGRGSPGRTASASASARSAQSATNAFSSGFSRSTVASEASTSSRAETSPARTAPACSTALRRRTSNGAPVSSAVAALLARSMSERVSSGPGPSAHRCRYPTCRRARTYAAQTSPLPIAQAVAAARAVRPDTPIFP